MGLNHSEVILVTEKSAEATFMSQVNRSNVHWVWPHKRDIQILNGVSMETQANADTKIGSGAEHLHLNNSVLPK